jgi:hypothetical protein
LAQNHVLLLIPQGTFKFKEMRTSIDNSTQLKIEKEMIWFLTFLLMIIGLPILKNAVIFILAKLYELFIQHGH